MRDTMKRHILWSLVICLGMTPLWSEEAHEDYEEQREIEFVALDPFTGAVRGHRVRLRTEPDLDSQVVAELSEDDYLMIHGLCDDFYVVDPPKEIKGYIYRTYVWDGVVEGAHVNVRLAPDTEAPIVAQLNQGDPVDGKICPKNHRWLEIDLPNEAQFYVAKEYIEQVGDASLLAERGVRAQEVHQLLIDAYLASQTELSQPFEQVDIEAALQVFQPIFNEYTDFPSSVAQAKEMLEAIQELYLHKKLVYLEGETHQTLTNWEMDRFRLNSELAQYEEKLLGFGRELGCPLEELPSSISLDLVSEVLDNEVEVSLGEVSEVEKHLGEISLESAAETFEAAKTPVQALTDKMATWLPVEEALYQSWAINQANPSMEEYYREQSLEAMELRGTIEPYDVTVMNRPGDYLLKVNQVNRAILYSTQVNLEKKVGKQVRLKVLERPDHGFAFPAYFVIAVN